MTSHKSTNGGPMGARITTVRRVFFTGDDAPYVVRITKWTGGKADTIEMFQIKLNPPPANEHIAITMNRSSPLHVKFPKREK